MGAVVSFFRDLYRNWGRPFMYYLVALGRYYCKQTFGCGESSISSGERMELLELPFQRLFDRPPVEQILFRENEVDIIFLHFMIT